MNYASTIFTFNYRKSFLKAHSLIALLLVFSWLVLLHSNSSNNDVRNKSNVEITSNNNVIQDKELKEVNHDYKTFNASSTTASDDVMRLSTQPEGWLPWWEDNGIKSCDSHPPIQNYLANNLRSSYINLIGHCGYRASVYGGKKQTVVSFSLYGENEEYWKGFPDILNQINVLYPGWLVRLHTNPRGRFKYLCPLMIKYRSLFICDVTNLPSGIGDVNAIDAMLWRSAPMGDEMVERFIVRDSDSMILERDRAAVEEWEVSKLLMHSMHDHPYHTSVIMGGLFGVYQPQQQLHVFEKIRHRLFTGYTILPATDQMRLHLVIPAVLLAKFTLHHASYNCAMFPSSRPFPTQRVNGTYVGSPLYRASEGDQSLNVPCPMECRPKQHQDWVYC